MVTLLAVEPRIHVAPRTSRSLGDDVIVWADEHGVELDESQKLVVRDGFRVDRHGRWAAFEVGVNQARQNGKGVVLMVSEAYGLFELGEELIIHSAHEFPTSQEHMRRLELFVRDNDDLLEQVKRGRGGTFTGFSHSHGDEKIELEDGRRIMFRTRTKSGGRGLTGDRVVLDEAMILPESAHQVLLPTLRARSLVAPRGVQVWYAGSAVDQEIHQHGLVWTRLRERAIKRTDPDLVYAEWSVDAEHPAEVSDEMAADEELWHLANPALGIRIDVEHMRRELRSLSPRAFAVELLGVGDYPSTDESASSVISLEEWAALENPESRIAASFCLAFDVSPDRRTSIARVGRNDAGAFHVELVENRTGTGWLPELLAEKAAAHDVDEVVCDGYGPSASVVTAVEEFGVKVRRLQTSEVGQACGRLQDAVSEKRLQHRGSPELANALRGARARPLGDAWAWARKNSSVDISPLVAVTLALSAAMDQPESGEPVIY